MNTHCKTGKLLAGATITAFLISHLPAQDIVWNGGADNNNFLDPANWVGAPTLPTDGTARLQLTGGVRNNPVLNTDYELRRLYFDSGAQSFDLSGSGILKIKSTGANEENDGIRSYSANTQTIRTAIQLTGDAPVMFSNSGGGALVFDGNIDQDGKQLQFRTSLGNSNITVNGVISGGGGLVIRGRSGNNINNFIRLAGNNTFTGAEVHQFDGHLRLAHDNALGFSKTLNVGLAGNATSYVLTEGARSISQNIRLRSVAGNTYNIGAATAHTSTYSGNIILNTANVTPNSQTAQAVTLTAVENARVNFDGNITREAAATGDGDNVTKAGLGTVALNGADNNYSGETFVDSGTLLINGTLTTGGGAVNVASGATLGGNNGIIQRAVNFADGAIFAPGDGGVGILTIDGPLNIDPGAIFNFDIGDSLFLTSGDLTLAGTLNIISTAGFAEGQSTYELISLAAGTITNNGFTLGNSTIGNYNLELDFDMPGKLLLVVTAVPEPTTSALVIGCAILALSIIRRRR